MLCKYTGTFKDVKALIELTAFLQLDLPLTPAVFSVLWKMLG